MSEKEVAREAVMKGTHINLAKQFLSRKLDVDDADVWFKNEVSFIFSNDICIER